MGLQKSQNSKAAKRPMVPRAGPRGKAEHEDRENPGGRGDAAVLCLGYSGGKSLKIIRTLKTVP